MTGVPAVASTVPPKMLMSHRNTHQQTRAAIERRLKRLVFWRQKPSGLYWRVLDFFSPVLLSQEKNGNDDDDELNINPPAPCQ